MPCTSTQAAPSTCMLSTLPSQNPQTHRANAIAWALYQTNSIAAPFFFSLDCELLMDGRNFPLYLHTPSTYVYLFFKYILIRCPLCKGHNARCWGYNNEWDKCVSLQRLYHSMRGDQQHSSLWLKCKIEYNTTSKERGKNCSSIQKREGSFGQGYQRRLPGRGRHLSLA